MLMIKNDKLFIPPHTQNVYTKGSQSLAKQRGLGVGLETFTACWAK